MKDYMIIKNQRKLYFFYKFYKNIPIYEMYRITAKARKLLKHFPFKNYILYNNWIFQVRNKKNIIIFETKYSKEISKIIKEINPDCRVILYYWNTINDRARISYLEDKNIDDFYTFDRIDAKKYNLKYNPQFYSKTIELPKSENIKYDVFFLGRDKGRKKELLSLEKKLNKLGISTKIMIIENEKNFISYKKYLYILSESKVILDFVNSNQNGLSLRCMESIFFSKKLITNNSYIKEYDFYNKNNILILDNKKSINKIKEFINTPYKSIDKEMINYYDYSSWIERFDK